MPRRCMVMQEDGEAVRARPCARQPENLEAVLTLMLLLAVASCLLLMGVAPLWWLGVSICFTAVIVASSYATHTPQ